MKTKLFVLAAILALAGGQAHSHCDTLDGPVVHDARAAIEKGDVAPALKWVPKAGEPEIRAAFAKTIKTRLQGDEARDLADRWFFETLVRVHRAGEGEPFTGLKPAGTDPGPGVRAADKALETGTVDDLAREIAERAAEGVRERFIKVLEARKHAGHSVEAGREYTNRYVDYVHYVERLHKIATAGGANPAHEGHPSH